MEGLTSRPLSLGLSSPTHHNTLVLAMGLSRCAIIALLLATPTLSLPSQLIFESAAVIPTIASLSLSSPDHSRLAAHIASFPEIRLVRLAEGAEAVRITEGEKALLVHEGIRFVDVTDDVEGMTVQATRTSPSPRIDLR